MLGTPSPTTVYVFLRIQQRLLNSQAEAILRVSSAYPCRRTKCGNIYPCRVCGRTLLSIMGRNRHEALHLGKGFACPVCKKVFTMKTNLQRHIDGVHEKKTHVCQHCNIEYSAAYYLRHHLKNCPGKKTDCVETISNQGVSAAALSKHVTG